MGTFSESQTSFIRKPKAGWIAFVNQTIYDHSNIQTVGESDVVEYETLVYQPQPDATLKFVADGVISGSISLLQGYRLEYAYSLTPIEDKHEFKVGVAFYATDTSHWVPNVRATLVLNTIFSLQSWPKFDYSTVKIVSDFSKCFKAPFLANVRPATVTKTQIFSCFLLTAITKAIDGTDPIFRVDYTFNTDPSLMPYGDIWVNHASMFYQVWDDIKLHILGSSEQPELYDDVFDVSPLFDESNIGDQSVTAENNEFELL